MKELQNSEEVNSPIEDDSSRVGFLPTRDLASSFAVSANEDDSEKANGKIWIYLVKFIHLIFLLFIVFAPFSNEPEILFLHASIIPFLWLHWLTNNNTCSLTTLEKFLQKKFGGEVKPSECFTCSIIEPVYDITKNNNSNKLIYGATSSLWLLSLYKLNKKYKNGEIPSIKKLAFPYFYPKD